MSRLATQVLNDINNTLDFLLQKKLLYYYNPPRRCGVDGVEHITWFNHESGGPSKESCFGSLEQYASFVKNGSFHALICDGSLLKVSYKFFQDELLSHSLWYWPCPFSLDDFEDEPLLDVVEAYIDDESWHQYIKMRTPIRFDYDAENSSQEHPLAHMHFQDSNCRLKVVSPMCFSSFAKFVFDNFYPELAPSVQDWKHFSNCLRKLKLPPTATYTIRDRHFLGVEEMTYPFSD